MNLIVKFKTMVKATLKKMFAEKPTNFIWYLVDFSDAAKEYSVGNDFCKKIYTMYGKNWAGTVEDYTDTKLNMLKQDNQIIIDLTQGQIVPKESVFIPRTDAAFGTIQLSKRVY